jgi:PIN domain nuclease of toxin-antitoxin system
VRLLLDTHVYIWLATDDRRLSLKARKSIASSASKLFLSAASAYELVYKHRAGQLPGADFLVLRLEDDLAERAVTPLPIAIEHGRRAGDLPTDHRDPFDRLLAAQAIVEDMAIVSNDEKLSALGARRGW